MTAARRAMTAVLDAGSGAVLFGTSAISTWDVPGYQLEPFHVLQPRGGLRPRDPISRVHLSRTVPPHHVKVVDGVPVTSPTRTLFDLAAMDTISSAKLERTIDTAWAKRLTTGPLLHAMLDEMGRRGRPGITRMRELLDVRGLDYVPPESSLERRFHQLLADDHQEPMDRQPNLGGEQWLARVDACDWVARVIAQIHSDRFHTALLDRAHDERQNVALRAAGFVVVEIWENEVWYHGDYVQQRMRRERADGRRRWRGKPWRGGLVAA
jgi:hypothetical protein